VLQLTYNLLATRDLHSIAGDILSSQVGVLTRSPLAYGLLCGLWSPEKIFEEGDHRKDRWSKEELKERLKHVVSLRSLVKNEIHTIRSVALRYVLANQLVGSMIIGARNASQLESNLRAIGDEPPYLSIDDLAAIPKLLHEAGFVE
jgi:aryl-alcohol dehydrogenase-like predicted oxidoreductase